MAHPWQWGMPGPAPAGMAPTPIRKVPMPKQNAANRLTLSEWYQCLTTKNNYHLLSFEPPA